jgi:hypothetical protein
MNLRSQYHERMDEPDPTQSAAKAPVAVAPSSAAEESAVARGSQVIKISPERSARTEHSVVEGLPDGKTERIASMRRELADLQQHLIQAQQRVATELQGRVEDAERLEALETFVQEHEVVSQKEATRVGELETEIAGLRSQLATATATTEELRRDLAARDARVEEARRQHREELEARSSSLSEVKTLLEARDAELATRTTERETDHATRSRLELELETHRTQHRDVTEQLELQSTSLRDAKALLATLTAELTAATSERDACKSELDASRTKLCDVANQLVRLAQDVGDGGAIAKRPQPPPVPPRAAAPATPVEVEAILMTEEARPASRIGSALFVLGGVIVGCAITIAIMKWSSTPDDQGATTLVAAPVSAERNPVMRAENIPPSTSGQPTPASDTMNAQPEHDSAPVITAPLITNATDGVIVLPASAAGHRVFVDGRLVEVKNSRASVPCGSHEVRIGSSGMGRKLDIECGGETVLPDEPRRE